MNSITFFMKAFWLSVLLSISFFSFGQKHTSSIGFIENKGQIVDQKGKENKGVKYLLNANGLNVQLRQNGFSYDVYEVEKIPLTKTDKEFYSLDSKEKDNKPDFSTKINFHRIDIDFLNSNKNIQLLAEEKSADYDNYYNVLHAPDGITNVHKYQKVTYKNIYNNIDVVFFIPKDSTKVVEYNFIIKPGGKVSDIQLKFNGAKTDLIDNKIQMNLCFGQMEETIPLSWTEKNNGKEEININYKKLKKNIYGFEGDLNNSDKTIVIDPVPVRLWATFYGGNGVDTISLLSVDNNNNLYICGGTGSTSNIATSGVFNSTFILDTYGYVAKLDSNGIRIWGTYLFGEIEGATVDNQMNFIFVGSTIKTTNIATVGSHQPTYNGATDGFICKLDSMGLRDWSSYYGGERNDLLYEVSIDNNNNIYACGVTSSINEISTVNSFKPNLDTNNTPPFGGGYYGDGIIVKFSPNGDRIWSTYYGGEYADYFNNCYVSNDNYLYLTGGTRSNLNISTTGSYQENLNGSSDAMIVKFNLNGQRIWGTYIGGEGNDNFNRKGEIKNNFLYLVGVTYSVSNISTTGTFQETFPSVISSAGVHGIIKFNVNSQTKVWGTYFNDRINTVSVNSLDEVYFAGETSFANNIATSDGYQPIKNQFMNCYLIKLNSNGQRVWGTYYSGNSATQLGKTKVDNLNNIYLSGLSNGNTTGISTPNSHQPVSASFQDAFLVKFLDCQSAAIANSNSPICVGSNLELTASGGTNYNWTGPNGFTSTNQNPIIPNASVVNSGQYTCEITGTGGCDNTISLNVIVGDIIAPVPNITSLPQINGDCNTVISSIPTALDNCTGTINATTTDPLTYSVPGNYTITWNFDDGNGNSSSQTQNVTITSVNPPTLTSPQTFCFQDNATISNIAIIGQNITWYDALTGGNILASTTALQNGVTYYATQTINGCESDRTSVLINIQVTDTPIGYLAQTFCSDANSTLNDIVVTGINIIWYDSFVGGSIIPSTTVLQHQTNYYCTQTINGCESFRKPINIYLTNTLNALNYQETICDDLDDGFEIINLTSFNSNLITTTGNTFSYYTSLNGAENQISSAQINNVSNYNLNIGTTTIFVRIDSQNGCHQVVELKLTLVSKPRITISDIMPICEGTSITINAGNGFDSYNWSTGATTQSTIVSQAGNYSVTVTENHNGISCSSTKNFTVVNSNAATVSEIITSDWTDSNNTITVLISNSSVGDYVYSLDGINYQNSNVFYELESGEHTVFVKDTNGCGISSEEIYLLMYPKYFTPNGDSYNDTWKIKFSQKEPNLKVAIFDRYGKLLKIMNSYDAWDGKLNGKDLPSDDYWFVVTRQNGKEFRGHFAMKR